MKVKVLPIRDRVFKKLNTLLKNLENNELKNSFSGETIIVTDYEKGISITLKILPKNK